MTDDTDPTVATGAVIHDRSVTTVGDLLDHAVRKRPDGEFLRDEDESLTFAQAHRRVRRFATVLTSCGIDQGDRVAILLPNSCTWPLLWLAVLRLGAIAVPVNFVYQREDLRFVLTDSEASVLVTVNERRELVESVRDGCPALQHILTSEQLSADPHTAATVSDPAGLTEAHLANLQYTSGTTGFPKACMLSHDYWIRVGELVSSQAQVTPNDVTITAQPYSYVDPLWNTMVALTSRIPLVVLPRFSASGFWSSVRQHGVTFFYVLGTMPQLLLRQPPGPQDRNHRVRLVLCSGIAPDVHTELEQRWGAPWRETYGLTETGMDITTPISDEGSVGSGTLGYPVSTKQAAIVDENNKPLPPGSPGEIVVRGLPMMDGYWNRPEATATTMAAGWLHTGDLGVRDDRGRYRIVGRIKDMIRRGGDNISAAEVEDVLNQCPLVLTSAVVAEPDPLWGETVKAFIHAAEGVAVGTDSAQAIRDHARARLARFKVPRYVHFVDRLPMTVSERVAKPQLIEEYRHDTTGLFDTDDPMPPSGE